MQEKYDPQSIEARWRTAWERDALFQVDEDPAKQRRFYALTMFPYPSGDRLHMGHMRTYTITDAVARWKRMQGYHVIHPMGWDAFGLPAENAAIKRGIHPAKWTFENIEYIRDQQMKRMGFSYDWKREICSCSPDYYRWNQWFFLKLYEHGLAYRKEAAVNWCPDCATVLANEQVEDGRCWRCESLVEKKNLMQWFFKITDCAEELLAGLADLPQWPDKVKAIQRNWIGKSTGAELEFAVDSTRSIKVFTTRPDTACGVTYLVLAPEHPLVEALTAPAQSGEVRAFVERVKRMSELDRTGTEVEKEGVPIGAFATNPFTGKQVPVWIANYVVYEYGTGAVMGVPAHDERDFDFASKYGLPVQEVVAHLESPEGAPKPLTAAYTEPGKMVNSGQFNGLASKAASPAMTEFAAACGFGQARTTYRLRDWLISRQRYWGTPIPMVHCASCGTVPLGYEQLPLVLPQEVQFTGQGKSPLLSAPEWVATRCPKCGGPAQRETDTMDGFMCSSWYFMRYVDPHNDQLPFDPAKARYWLPVNLYVGGTEHAVMHLLYFRFFNRFCHRLGLVPTPEPVIRLFTQGTVRYNGMRMSKSKGNAVSPNELADQFGADTARVFTLFAAPPEFDLDWIDTGVEGAFRFLSRVWRNVYEAKKVLGDHPARSKGNFSSQEAPNLADRELRRQAHLATKKVSDDLEREFAFNTAISAIMVLSNAIGEYLRNAVRTTTAGAPNSAAGATPALELPVLEDAVTRLVLLLAPFAPHLSEELWRELGHHDYVAFAPWPTYEPEALATDEVELAVQINGKLRGHVTVPASADQETIKAIVTADEAISAQVGTAAVNKVVVVPGRLVNLVLGH